MAYRTDPRDYLEPPSRRKFNETLEKEVMRFMKPRNFNYYIGSSYLSDQEATEYGPKLEKVEKWYQTAYTNTQIDEADIKAWENVELHPELHLPELNQYIPDNFKILKPPSTPVTYSEDITPENSHFKVWWYQDTVFEQPKISIDCQFFPKTPDHTRESLVKAELLYQIYGMNISEVLYPATLVDYSLDIGFKSYWALSLSGFSDNKKVEKILEQGIKTLLDLSFDKDESYFNDTIISPTKTFYENIDNWQTTSVANNYLMQLQDSWQLQDSSLSSVAETMNQTDIKKYRNTFISDISGICSVSGNVDKEQAINYVKVLEDSIPSSKLSKDDRIDQKYNGVRKFIKGKTLIVRKVVTNAEQPNSAIIMSYQVGNTEFNGYLKDRTKYTRDILLSLLALALREPCFNYLRTQKQLGYVVHCYENRRYNISSFEVMVQGSRKDAGPNVMAKEIIAFIQQQYDTLKNKTSENEKLFDSIKTALQKTLEEKPRSSSAKNRLLTNEIFSRDRNFNRTAEMLAALEDVVYEDFVTFYQHYLLSEQRRQCSLEVYSQALTLPSEDQKYDPSDIVVPNNADLAEYRDANLTKIFKLKDDD